ncbi:MAG: FAD-dependent 5-carboxymethylaminomethyl-2-thiouridine(34) oxidoreductase MnmC, partial [Pseudomonadales bacterium]|nr:FAD-dependent 5-carboxymethylaminomethyl-2-thiouridine(34) oxidoreductase MnmC [Pseudomonadales bacterium]
QYQGPSLIYVATELHPLTAATMEEAHRAGPFATLAATLAAHWPIACPGLHCIDAIPRIRLWLLLGDSTAMLSRIDLSVDAWFLDGFSPATNPAMWSPELWAQLARLSRPGTTLATYSSAGHVRRGLQDAGFEVSKRSGIGGKRESLRGIYTRPQRSTRLPPGFQLPQPRTEPAHIVIIGAGIAGAATAAALQTRGLQPTVIDSLGIAGAASGNAVGMLGARLSDMRSAPDSWLTAAMSYTWQAARRWNLPLQTSLWQADQRRDQDPAWLTALIEMTKKNVIHVQGSAWGSPIELCHRLMGTIPCLRDTVTELLPNAQGWTLQLAKGGSLTADAVILCTGHQTTFTPDLAVEPVAGQVETIPAAAPAGAWKDQTYLISSGELILTGASFRRGTSSTEISLQERHEHLAQARQLNPELAELFTQNTVTSRCSVRATSADHRPMIGGVPDIPWLSKAYADLAHGWRRQHQPLHYLPGLYINSAHGSHGLTQALLAGELIACMMRGEPLPLLRSLQQQIHPARFHLKALQRR